MIRARYSLIPMLLTAVASMFACGDDASPEPGAAGAGGSTAAQGGAGQGGAEAGQGGSTLAGGSSGEGGAGPGGATGTGTTSEMCGSVAILGQQGADTSEACAACANTSCCTQAAACGAIEACSPYRACLAPCKTKACSDACDAMYPEAVGPSSGFATCRNTKCATQCQEMRCLGKVGPGAPGAPTLAVTIVPTDFQTGKVVANVTIKQCKRSDLTCAAPTDTQTTNAQGEAKFAAVAAGDAGLDDYFEMTEAAYESTLWFNVASAAFPVNDGIVLAPRFISKQTWTLLTSVIPATPDAARGHVAYLATTCTGANASGVSVTADTTDATTIPVYIEGGLPTKAATETDTSGAGAFVNLLPGPVVLSGKLAASGTVVGTTTVFARAGFVTTTNVIPRP